MKKVLTIAAAVGFVTIPSIAFANAGSGTSTTVKPVVPKTAKHVEVESEHGAEVRVVAQSNSTPTTSTTTPSDVTTPTPAITEAEAKTIAQNTKDTAIATKVELETEHGVLVYEVHFDDGSKVYVDANTGAIISDDDDADDDENEHNNSGPSAQSGRSARGGDSDRSGRN